MERPTIATVAARTRVLAEEAWIACPKTSNKGDAGILLELLTGIPSSSAHLDCLDGEVKTFPLKRNRDGSLVPKETIAVTMVNAKSLTDQCDFATSTCGSKLAHVLYIPYLRESDTHVKFFPPTEVTLTADVLALLSEDYRSIRDGFLTHGELTSKTGAFLQNRTKGAGGSAPKTRAFYLKKEFIRSFITKTW